MGIKGSQIVIYLTMMRLFLSMTFISAGYYKITDPAGFAAILYGYSVFPEFSIHFLAVTIPFIELLAGFCLLFNVLPASSLILINALISGCILMVGFNLLRGLRFDYGSVLFSAKTHPLGNGFLLIRDILMLWAGIFLLKKTIPS